MKDWVLTLLGVMAVFVFIMGGSALLYMIYQ